MNILISAAATAYAYQLERMIHGAEKVFFADSADLPQFMLKDRKFIRIPAGSSSSFAHELLTACLDHNIEKVFVLRRAEIKALAEAKVLFAEFGIEAMVPPLSVLDELEMKGRPGTILLKDNDNTFPGLPSQADRGVFLMGSGEAGTGISIFTAD